MKCDDLLQYLETGNIAQQVLARVHAVRCRRCATVRDTWLAAKRELSSAEPLTLSQRHVWERAAREAVVQPKIRWQPMPTAVVAALAACVLAAVLWTGSDMFHTRPKIDGSGKIQVADVSPVREISVSEEFASLETRVAQLGLELAALGPQADLLDARQQVNDILNQYSKW